MLTSLAPSRIWLDTGASLDSLGPSNKNPPKASSACLRACPALLHQCSGLPLRLGPNASQQSRHTGAWTGFLNQLSFQHWSSHDSFFGCITDAYVWVHGLQKYVSLNIRTLKGMCVCSRLSLSLFVLWGTYMMAGAGTASLGHEMEQGEPYGTVSGWLHDTEWAALPALDLFPDC